MLQKSRLLSLTLECLKPMYGIGGLGVQMFWVLFRLDRVMVELRVGYGRV